DPDPGSLLYVRGAAADLKLVYLDGAPVYAPFPLGGILEPFPPGLLDKASIYLGGAPARYDGGLSYVMDLRTRGGRGGLSTSGSVDLLSGHVMAEGALGDAASAVVSLRGMDPLGSAALFGDGMPYEYREGLARTDVRLGTTSVLSVTGFANREAVRVDEALGGDGLIEWGNNAGSARRRGVVGSGVGEATAAGGRRSARLPRTGSQVVLAGGGADRARRSLDLSRPIEDVQLSYGATLEYQEYRAQAEPVDGGLPPSEASAEGSGAGVYAELSGQQHP